MLTHFDSTWLLKLGCPLLLSFVNVFRLAASLGLAHVGDAALNELVVVLINKLAYKRRV